MRIVVSAGEPSGRVMRDRFSQEMACVDPNCEVISLDEPAQLGPVFGFAEGLRSGHALGGVLSRAEEAVAGLEPDAAVLISFSGLHLPLGRRLRARGVPVLYLGPPQVWAWGGWRKRRLRVAADRVVCLFRFEEDLLRGAGVRADYLGYPLLDGVVACPSRRDALAKLGFGPSERYVVFLPGSRPAEVAYHVPLFEATYERLLQLSPNVRGVMVDARSLKPQASSHKLEGERNENEESQELEARCRKPDAQGWGAIGGRLLTVSENRYDIMRHADCACAVSGTVTAELAILGVPMAVCYHLSQPSRLLARALVRSRYFALPNILAGAKVVPEELEPGPNRLAELLAPLVRDSEERRTQVAALDRARAELGPPGAMARICRLALRMKAEDGSHESKKARNGEYT